MKDLRTFENTTGVVSYEKKNAVFLFIRKHFKIIVLVVLLMIPLLLMVIPVKIPIEEKDIDKSREWYVVRFIAGDVTDGGCYISDCSKNELIGKQIYFDGNIPSAPIDYLSGELSLCAENKYVVYGRLEKETDTYPHPNMLDRFETRQRYMLKMDDWKMLGSIKTTKGETKSYLTLFDLDPFPWFGKYCENYHSVHISDDAKNGKLDDHTYKRDAV